MYLTGSVPRERFPEVVGWWFPLIGENTIVRTLTRIWQMRMPTPVFANVKELIETSIGSDWAELTRKNTGTIILVTTKKYQPVLTHFFPSVIPPA